MKKHALCFPLTLSLALLCLVARAKDGDRQNLIEWQIEDSDLVSDAPNFVSAPSYSTDHWISAKVPSTVMAALLAAGQYQDPFFGKQLLSLPGTGSAYEIGKNYGFVPTPRDSPFGRPWWYRTEFDFAKTGADQRIDLNLNGFTYGADIWVNGAKIAGLEDTKGSYRTHSFAITELLHPGKNAIAVLVYPPRPVDLTPSWVDWNPTPQDKNMGLWREVFLSKHGAVSLRYPQVLASLDRGFSRATLRVEVEASNQSEAPVTSQIKGTIEGLVFSQSISLAPHETKLIVLDAAENPTLRIDNPRLWWPAQMGKPELYSMHLEAVMPDGMLSDQTELEFGIRQIDSKLTADDSRLFFINGKPIQIRGGGWSSDMFLRFSPERLEKEFALIKDLGLNTIRLEGRFEDDHLLKLADQNGILVMPGWVCCNAWQDADRWPKENIEIAAASLRDLIYQFRAHPSVFVFLYGSDEAPPLAIEKLYLETFKKYHWPNPTLASAKASESRMTGPTGVKMTGPYDYTPPSYWYIDSNHGGAFGFNTETSPGSSVPPLASLKAFLPADHLWPIDDVWDFHAGEDSFHTIKPLVEGLERRYGPSHSIEEFAKKAQVMGYDNNRAMFEAYGKNKYHSATGIVAWMLNNAWPSLIWHLYDYYLRAGGAYYGIKKANEPLHLQYSYDDQSIVLVNNSYQKSGALTAQIDLMSLGLQSLFSKTVKLAIEADRSQEVWRLPSVPKGTKSYFLKLALQDKEGKHLSDNFYWLSTQKEKYDWDHTELYTPVLQDADMTDLLSLKPTKVSVESKIDPVLKEGSVTISNLGAELAFFNELTLRQGDRDVLPAFWQDNYISLMPGETRELKVSFPDSDLSGESLSIALDGWNANL